MSIKQGGNTIAGAVGKYPLNERNISNCITNIPQDINLELSNGTLTLKAGSKVYVPNGVGVFDEITIASDLSVTPTWLNNNTGLVFYYLAENRITATETSYCVSGSTAPTYLDGGCWYDTTNNKVKKGTSSSWTDTQKISLPIAVVKSSSNSITSIDQVFNGFGYIGSTVFALPGVKGLIPDGRNADGSLKNTTTNDFTTVKTVQVNTSTAKIAMYSRGGLGSQTKNFGLNEVENYNYDSGILTNALEVASVIVDSSAKITAFTPKNAFHAVDYNETEFIANQAMPSDKYIDLTLGASGATYTAPADGYVAFSKYATGANQTINITCNHFISFVWAHIGSINIFTWMPVKKGDVFTVGYSAAGTYEGNYFRFIYAEGAQ